MKFFTAVYLAIAFASTSFAAPWPSSSKLSSRRSHVLGRGLQLEAYHPESTLEVQFFPRYRLLSSQLIALFLRLMERVLLTP
jgi:hypothetical protein